MPIVTAAIALLLLVLVLWDGFETIILPRRVTRKIRITRLFYRSTWAVWSAIGRRMSAGKRRETYLSVYGPLSIIVLLVVWALGLVISFGLLYWSIGSGRLWTHLYLSGSTFFTLGLGDVTPRTPLAKLVTVLEAGLGLAFLALVLSYLPVLYQAFSKREGMISLLDARAGSPASAVELLRRHGHGQGLGAVEPLLREWERWAAELLESHVSYPVLCYFRSQHDNQSWLAALTCILDTCTLAIHGIGGACRWQAQLTFAMARHAVVDLAQILGTPPVAPQPERLPPADFARLRGTLAKAGIGFEDDPATEENIAELRRMYEPFVNSLADRLLLRLPGWLPGGRLDNWRTSAWGRISTPASVLPLAGPSEDDHL